MMMIAITSQARVEGTSSKAKSVMKLMILTGKTKRRGAIQKVLTSQWVTQKLLLLLVKLVDSTKFVFKIHVLVGLGLILNRSICKRSIQTL